MPTPKDLPPAHPFDDDILDGNDQRRQDQKDDHLDIITHIAFPHIVYPLSCC